MTEQEQVQTEIQAESVPAEQEVEVQAEEPGESAPPEEQAAETPESAPETSEVQKRINQLTAEKYAARREKEELERKLQAVQATQPAQPATNVKPTLEQFDYDDTAYQDALIDWKVEQRIAMTVQQSRQNEVAKQQTAQQQKYNQKAAAFAGKTPDFYESVSAVPLQNDAAAKAILALENGPEVAYHLSKNLDIVDRLNTSDPITAIMEVGRLGGRLTPAKTKRTTSAPAPVTPIGSGGGVKDPLEALTPAGAFFE